MTVEELAEIVSGRVAGDPGTQIRRIADLDNADDNRGAHEVRRFVEHLPIVRRIKKRQVVKYTGIDPHMHH